MFVLVFMKLNFVEQSKSKFQCLCNEGRKSSMKCIAIKLDFVNTTASNQKLYILIN